jgi:RNA-directed DNA polymerase
MHGHGKSDGRVVPAKPANKAVRAEAESVEERRPAKGNTDSTTRPGHSAGSGVTNGLDRVRKAARREREMRGSQRSCTISTFLVCARPTGH